MSPDHDISDDSDVSCDPEGQWREVVLAAIQRHDYSGCKPRISDILADNIIEKLPPFFSGFKPQDNLIGYLDILVHMWNYLFKKQSKMLEDLKFKEKFLGILHKRNLCLMVKKPEELKLTGEHKLHIFWGFLTGVTSMIFEENYGEETKFCSGSVIGEDKDHPPIPMSTIHSTVPSKDSNSGQEFSSIALKVLGESKGSFRKFKYSYVKKNINILAKALDVIAESNLERYFISDMIDSYWAVKNLYNRIAIDTSRLLQKKLKDQIFNKLCKFKKGGLSAEQIEECRLVFADQRGWGFFSTHSLKRFEEWVNWTPYKWIIYNGCERAFQKMRS